MTAYRRVHSNSFAAPLLLLWHTTTVVAFLLLYSTSRPLTAWVALLVSVATCPLVSALIRPADLLSPQVMLPLTYLGYALGPLIGPAVDIRPSFTEAAYQTYVILQLVGLISMRVALWLSESMRVGASRSGPVSKSSNSAEAVAWPFRSSVLTAAALGVIAVPSLVFYFRAFGGLEGLLEVAYGADYYQTLSRNFTIGAGPTWILLAAVLLFVTGLRHRRAFCLLAAGVLATGICFVLLLIGARGTLVYTLLFGVVLFNYGVRPLRPGALLFGLTIGVILSVAYSFMRYYLPDLGLALTHTVRIILTNPRLLNPLASGEFTMPGSSLLELLTYDDVPLLLGRSYLGTIGQPFPFIARLFEDVGFDVSRWRLATFYPEILAVGGGLGFSPVAEGYINFRLAGVVLHMSLYGWIAGQAYNYLRYQRSFGALLFWAGTFPMFLLDGMRIHAVSMVYKWFRGYLMPWMVYWIVAVLTHGPPNSLAKKVARSL